jgi:hypothetical protein
MVQHLYAWSYAQTEHVVGDSLVLRQFCRLGFEPVPQHTTLMRGPMCRSPKQCISCSIASPNCRAV